MLFLSLTGTTSSTTKAPGEIFINYAFLHYMYLNIYKCIVVDVYFGRAINNINACIYTNW